MDGYRNIEPLPGVKGGNTPGMAPEIQFLEPRQLVVNEDYQRELSGASIRQIKRMAAGWDWSSFKAPNVARTADPEIYEVVDGQHTAIAAATNGNIPFLPCLIMDAETLKEKATGFLGINKHRIALTPAAIYAAQVAAQDEDAISAEVAMSQAGVRLLQFPPPKGDYKVGDSLAVGAIMALAKKHGSGRLTDLLRIAVAAQAAPVSAQVLKALDLALPVNAEPDVVNRITVILRGQGIARLDMIAKSRTPHGRRAYETLADIIADMAKLPAHRMGSGKAKLTVRRAA